VPARIAKRSRNPETCNNQGDTVVTNSGVDTVIDGAGDDTI
jgi:hypothetical protein